MGNVVWKTITLNRKNVIMKQSKSVVAIAGALLLGATVGLEIELAASILAWVGALLALNE